MSNLLQDLRHGLRSLQKNPGFTIVAVLTLVLGIGANTAVFSIVNALILRPYPFPSLDRLVLVRAQGPKVVSEYRIAPADFIDLEHDSKIFQGVAAFRQGEGSLTSGGDAEPVVTCAVSPNFFAALGAQPALGRTFVGEEAEPGRNQAVILKHGFWERRFASDAGIVGKAIEIDGQKLIVVGVMPRDFSYPPATDVWMPIALTAQVRAERDAQAVQGFAFQVIAKLRPEVSLGQAQSEMHAFAARLQQQYPATHENRSLKLLPLKEEQYGFTAPLFLMLQAAALMVLLLASANLINLFVTRQISRHKELALRTALGAGRMRLWQLFLGETIPLSVLAGAFAVAGSFATVTLVRDSIPVDYTKWIAGWSAIRVDSRVSGFALLITLLTGALFALSAVLQSGHYDLNQVLNDAGGRTATGAGKGRLRGTLVVSQVVFAMVLLVGAGLMVQGFFHLVNIYRTFDHGDVLTMRVSLPEPRYPDAAKLRSFQSQFLQGIAALPGVRFAGTVTNPPASNVDNVRTLFAIEGRTVLRQSDAPSADLQSASPGFFEALRIALLQGRTFSDQDGAEAPPVALISRVMASRFFPEGSAIGRRIKIGPPETAVPWMTIIGVVEDVQQNWWDKQPRPVIYLSSLQTPKRTTQIMVRTSSAPLSSVTAIRELARGLDPSISFEGLGSMEGSIADSLAPLRILGILMVIFGAVSLALAALGIYGVLAHSVAQRTREFGVRLALGAQRRDVLRLVIGESWKLAAIGLAIGLPLAYALTRVMGSLLYGVVAFNAVIFAALALALTVVALFAGYVPARRAMDVDPMVALRHE